MIESVIKNKHPTQKSPEPDQTFKEELTAILHKLFKELKREGILPNSCFQASVTLITKPDEKNVRKNTIDHYP